MTVGPAAGDGLGHVVGSNKGKRSGEAAESQGLGGMSINMIQSSRSTQARAGSAELGAVAGLVGGRVLKLGAGLGSLARIAHVHGHGFVEGRLERAGRWNLQSPLDLSHREQIS